MKAKLIALSLIVAAAAVAQVVIPLGSPTGTFEWEPNPEPDIAGYRLYYGTTSGTHPTMFDVGNITTATLPFPNTGTFYIVATAYNTSALESLPSDELVATITMKPSKVTSLRQTGP